MAKMNILGDQLNGEPVELFTWLTLFTVLTLCTLLRQNVGVDGWRDGLVDTPYTVITTGAPVVLLNILAPFICIA